MSGHYLQPQSQNGIYLQPPTQPNTYELPMVSSIDSRGYEPLLLPVRTQPQRRQTSPGRMTCIACWITVITVLIIIGVSITTVIIFKRKTGVQANTAPPGIQVTITPPKTNHTTAPMTISTEIDTTSATLPANTYPTNRPPLPTTRPPMPSPIVYTAPPTTSARPTTTSTIPARPTTPIKPSCSASSSCGSGYRYNPSSRTCFKENATITDWYTAQETCRTEGGYLATFNSSASVEWLAYQMKNCGWNTRNRYWIGGRMRSGQWEWCGLLTGPITMNRWAIGEPNEYRTGEDCMEITQGDPDLQPDYHWNDQLCDNTSLPPPDVSGFVCERYPISGGYLYD